MEAAIEPQINTNEKSFFIGVFALYQGIIMKQLLSRLTDFVRFSNIRSKVLVAIPKTNNFKATNVLYMFLIIKFITVLEKLRTAFDMLLNL